MKTNFQTIAHAWQEFGRVGDDMGLPSELELAEEPAFYAGAAAVLSILSRETDTSALFDRIAALMLEIRRKAETKRTASNA